MAGACVLLLLWRSSLRGPAAFAVCFMVVLVVGPLYQADLGLVMGLAALGIPVFFHSLVFPRPKGTDDLQVPGLACRGFGLCRRIGLGARYHGQWLTAGGRAALPPGTLTPPYGVRPRRWPCLKNHLTMSPRSQRGAWGGGHRPMRGVSPSPDSSSLRSSE